jgi:hypothetical protein
MIDPLADPLAPTNASRAPGNRADSSRISDATHPLPRDEHLRSQAVGSPPQRIGRRRLLELAARLPDRDRRILDTVRMLRLARGDQLRTLFFAELTTETARTRVCRRSLQRLTDQQLLRALERRVGGHKAGSNGHVYALTPAARRLLAHLNDDPQPAGRGVHEPGLLFLSHTLAIGDLYVQLIQAHRDGQLELLSFQAEPVREYTSPIGRPVRVRPDAFVQVAAGEFELLSFCELDLGTEGRGALERKLQAYIGLWRSGREQTTHGLFPLVVWITTTQARANVIASLINELPAGDRSLFATTTLDNALPLLAGEGAGDG